MMYYYTSFWKRYFDFKGTSTRKEYWIPMIINYLILFILLMGIFLIKDVSEVLFNTMIPILTLFAVVIVIPSIAIHFRRFHDAGRKDTMLIVYYIFSIISGIMSDFDNPIAVIVNILWLMISIYVLVIALLPSQHVTKENRSTF